MKVREFKEEVYKLFKEEIDAISEASEKEIDGRMWKADIGIATDMFLTQPHTEEVQAEIDELRAKITE